VLVAAGLAVVVGAACGSDSSGSSGSPGGPELAVSGKSFSFTPSTITVKAGEARTLAFTSKDIAHDFTVKELDIHVPASGGHTARRNVTFDKPGTYTFFCSVAGHREAGMTGTLVVSPG
jgi:plastocyanin